ncbi:MAG: hypothetical protein ACRDVK_01510 [Acidimicrobiia bacterium]
MTLQAVTVDIGDHLRLVGHTAFASSGKFASNYGPVTADVITERLHQFVDDLLGAPPATASGTQVSI